MIFAIVMLFFLPGFLLIQAMFPKKNELDENDDMLYRIVLGMAMSIVISILIGFFLASISPLEGGKGYFDTPYIVASLLMVSGVFFAIGWYRGAYPFTGRSTEPVPKLPIPRRNFERIQELLEDWQVYKKKILEYEREIKREDDDRKRNKYIDKRKRLLNRLKEIELRIKFLSDEKTRDKEGDELYDQIQELIYQWRKLRVKLEDLELQLVLARKKGQESKESKLLKKRERLKKKVEELGREITDLKDEVDEEGGR